MVRGTSARKTPSAVATPLPPRKPNQTGKQWPRTAASAATAAACVGLREAVRLGDVLSDDDSNEILQSIEHEGQDAQAFAPERATLVAPMLPLLCLSYVLMPEDANQQVAGKEWSQAGKQAGMEISQGVMKVRC